ncbi:multicopper oxidase family protein [Edaphobacter sp. HDX4]|uniref:multicopper oxidase family protein n=1 Tax=Edaphobacter sp. HDX4 TaxID=2794064 RepID=UPI002FE67C7C
MSWTHRRSRFIFRLSVVAPAFLVWEFAFAGFMGVAAAQSVKKMPHLIGPPLPPIPDAFSPVELRAVIDPHTGLSAFSYAAHEIPPVLHVSPGHTLRVDYQNSMSSHSKEICIDEPCRNMTNLHFHGLHVSPKSPQDDVISMMAMPGESLHYDVTVPEDQPPGLYWYHTHPHGESYQQDLDGMSGALIVDGIERYAPEVRSIRQQVLVLRDAVLKQTDPSAPLQRARVNVSNSCSIQSTEPERLFTVNGVLRPSVAIRPGERQFWRIVNASPDLYADVQLSSGRMTVIALDGMPLAFHDPHRQEKLMSHVPLPPGGRVEAIVTGPPAGAEASLITRCVNTGPDGDPNPTMVLADMNEKALSSDSGSRLITAPGQTVHQFIAPSTLTLAEKRPAEFSTVFTEDKQGFYINGQKYTPDAGPMITVLIGGYRRWTVVNRSREAHPFHIHQVHFLAYARDGVRLRNPYWLDTVNVGPGESLDLLMDFTDPIITGMSVFHCHLLKHEDKGMMAKILFIPPTSTREELPRLK